MIVSSATSRRVLPALMAVCLQAASAAAIEPKTSVEPFRMPAGLTLPDLQVSPSLVTYEMGEKAASLPQAVERFFAENGASWEVRWDERNQRPHLIQGQGVPMLPGRGNSLPARKSRATLAEVEALCRGFLARHPDLLQVAGLDLRLDPGRSIPYGPDDRVWFVELQQFHQGVPVEGANVYFRLNNGNLVQFGADRVADVAIDATPDVSRADALGSALRQLGLGARRIAETVDAGTLVIRPVLPEGEAVGEMLRGALGQGYAHRLMWDFTFRVAGDSGTYRVSVDAHDGALLGVEDVNMYADAVVDGGVFARSQLTPEFPQGLPFATVTNNGTKVTNAAGVYDYTGGTATVSLNGQFVRISDNCGAVSLTNATDGNLHFGTSAGTDCATPGVGGAGNTHSARTGFFHLTRINRKAQTFFPTNTWLNGTVQANMNIALTCNAFWNGSTVNFYRSGGGCNNTGEIAAVFLHEWGHGMDTNSGGSASGDQGSGEAVGDTFAFLETRKSCIGENFRATPCVNCTDRNFPHRSCTGVRDMAFFSLGGARALSRPSLVTDDNGINCDRFLTTTGAVNCPYLTNNGTGSPYRGAMGYEGHCESVISSGANWDLAQKLINRHGKLVGWGLMDDIWYGSLTPSKSAYRLVSGGQCNPAATVDGCAATNWYTVYLPVDDDDGNLANGTPNACRIYDAFNAHGIACGASLPCTQ
jgi:hypothetical protein